MNALHQAVTRAIASARLAHINAPPAECAQAMAEAAVGVCLAEAQCSIAGAALADALAAVQLDWYANDRQPEGDYGLPEALAEAAQDVVFAVFAALVEDAP